MRQQLWWAALQIWGRNGRGAGEFALYYGPAGFRRPSLPLYYGRSSHQGSPGCPYSQCYLYSVGFLGFLDFLSSPRTLAVLSPGSSRAPSTAALAYSSTPAPHPHPPFHPPCFVTFVTPRKSRVIATHSRANGFFRFHTPPWQ